MTQHHLAGLLALALALTGCGPTRPVAGRSTPSPHGISVEDRIAIADLIHRYSYTWDSRDADGWVDLFTDDAVIQASFVGKLAWSYGSIAERRAFINGFYETLTKQGLMNTRHVQAATILSPNGDGSVDGQTMFVVAFQYRGEPKPRITNTGIYRDRFVRTPAGWKFARRDILVDQQ